MKPWKKTLLQYMFIYLQTFNKSAGIRIMALWILNDCVNLFPIIIILRAMLLDNELFIFLEKKITVKL